MDLRVYATTTAPDMKISAIQVYSEPAPDADICIDRMVFEDGANSVCFQNPTLADDFILLQESR